MLAATAFHVISQRCIDLASLVEVVIKKNNHSLAFGYHCVLLGCAGDAIA